MLKNSVMKPPSLLDDPRLESAVTDAEHKLGLPITTQNPIPSLDTQPPVVVRTDPVLQALYDVAPGTNKITLTFSKEMAEAAGWI